MILDDYLDYLFEVEFDTHLGAVAAAGDKKHQTHKSKLRGSKADHKKHLAKKREWKSDEIHDKKNRRDRGDEEIVHHRGNAEGHGYIKAEVGVKKKETW